jgi:hypothetical protein
MALVGANDVNVTFPFDDFAVFTNFPNAGTDFHRIELTFCSSVEFSKRPSIEAAMAGPQGLIHVSLLTPPSQQSLPQKANAARRPGLAQPSPLPGNASLGNWPLKPAPTGGPALQADSYPRKTKAKGPKFSRRYRRVRSWRRPFVNEHHPPGPSGPRHNLWPTVKTGKL